MYNNLKMLRVIQLKFLFKYKFD